MPNAVEIHSADVSAPNRRCIGRYEVAACLDGGTWTSTSPCHGSRSAVELADLDSVTYATVTTCALCSALWEVSFPLGARGSTAVAVWIG